MVASLVIACYLKFIHPETGFAALESWQEIVIGAALTTLIWIAATFFTPPTDDQTLSAFYKKIKPAGPGWKAFIEKVGIDTTGWQSGQLPLELLGMLLGCLTVYSALFATGFWIYGQLTNAVIFTMVAGLGAFSLFQIFSKIRTEKNT